MTYRAALERIAATSTEAAIRTLAMAALASQVRNGDAFHQENVRRAEQAIGALERVINNPDALNYSWETPISPRLFKQAALAEQAAKESLIASCKDEIERLRAAMSNPTQLGWIVNRAKMRKRKECAR